MRTPQGVEHWYLKVIDSLAPTGKVGTLSIEDMGWGEVDFLNDIEVATKLTDGWGSSLTAGTRSIAESTSVLASCSHSVPSLKDLS